MPGVLPHHAPRSLEPGDFRRQGRLPPPELLGALFFGVSILLLLLTGHG